MEHTYVEYLTGDLYEVNIGGTYRKLHCSDKIDSNVAKQIKIFGYTFIGNNVVIIDITRNIKSSNVANSILKDHIREIRLNKLLTTQERG